MQHQVHIVCIFNVGLQCWRRLILQNFGLAYWLGMVGYVSSLADASMLSIWRRSWRLPPKSFFTKPLHHQHQLQSWVYAHVIQFAICLLHLVKALQHHRVKPHCSLSRIWLISCITCFTSVACTSCMPKWHLTCFVPCCCPRQTIVDLPTDYAMLQILNQVPLTPLVSKQLPERCCKQGPSLLLRWAF